MHREKKKITQDFSFSNSRTVEDVEFSASSDFLRAPLKPNTMNKFVRVRRDSAPPCNQSTLDKEVPYWTFAVPRERNN